MHHPHIINSTSDPSGNFNAVIGFYSSHRGTEFVGVVIQNHFSFLCVCGFFIFPVRDVRGKNILNSFVDIRAIRGKIKEGDPNA